MSKALVQKQFGDKAEAYAKSAVHAKGNSLARLRELLAVEPHWLGLDIATAAGHTAHTLAEGMQGFVVSDITPQMLPKARDLATEKGITGIMPSAADAESLPFQDKSFDLVTCRIAPHHFPDIPRFVSEAARVLKPGGRFAVVDNLVPSTGSRKKKDQVAFANAAEYVNSFEKLRDPSHAACLSLYAWKKLFALSGFAIVSSETMRKKMDFDPWADRMRVTPEDKIRLKSMLIQAPDVVKEFLTPQISGDRIEFYLTEGILIGEKISD
ncbi:MAG: methyltransferase domain-containing protein [Chloroflexota bacterium]